MKTPRYPKEPISTWFAIDPYKLDFVELDVYVEDRDYLWSLTDDGTKVAVPKYYGDSRYYPTKDIATASEMKRLNDRANELNARIDILEETVMRIRHAFERY